MKVVRISLLGLALTASATVGFAQKTKIVTKQCLDSVSSVSERHGNIVSSSSSIYSYDKRGNNTQTVSYNQGYPSTKNEYTYDDKGNLTMRVSYTPSNDNTWARNQKYEYTYDEKGNRTVFLHSMLWGSADTFPTSRNEYTYNKNGYMTEDKGSHRNTNSSTWMAGQTHTYVYSSNGNLTRHTCDDLYQYQYEYDEEENLVLRINFTKECVGNTCYFIESTRTKYEHTYDNDGMITETITYNWNYTKKIWESKSKEEYTYDAKGNITTQTSYTYSSNTYTGYSKNEYAYDLQYSKTDLVIPNIDYTYNYMLKEQKLYSLYSGGKNDSTVYYWSPREIEVDDDEEDETGIVSATLNNQLWVYPNPANGQLTIECRDVINHVSTVEIYNVVGQKLYTSPNPSKGGELAPSLLERAGGEVVIDISHLANGMYFLKINNQVVKFIKE